LDIDNGALDVPAYGLQLLYPSEHYDINNMAMQQTLSLHLNTSGRVGADMTDIRIEAM